MESSRQSLLPKQEVGLPEQSAQRSFSEECKFSPFQSETSVDASFDLGLSKSTLNSTELYEDYDEMEVYGESAGSVEYLEAERPDDVQLEESDTDQSDRLSDGGSVVEAPVSRKSAELAKQKTLMQSTLEGNDCIELEEEVTLDVINAVKSKLETYHEQKEMFKSVHFDFLPGEDLSDLLYSPDDTNETTETTGTKHEIDLLNELKRMKLELKRRNKQLDKATELMKMMKRGLVDRGSYIKMLIQDNKKLRKEVKLSMSERQAIWEQFTNEAQGSQSFHEFDGAQAADLEYSIRRVGFSTKRIHLNQGEDNFLKKIKVAESEIKNNN
ncbi:uncharacterized protein [Rhodnius prolixus]|uniref:uncharacterized protein n=1 Tax=Rhodnius prolixus TaxID=13249 RepID=UPI003D187C26